MKVRIPCDRICMLARLIFVAIILIVVVLSFGKKAEASVGQELGSQLRTTYQQIIGEMPALASETDAQRLVRKLLLPHIDTTTAAKLTLGRNYRKMNAAQFERYRKAMVEIQVRTYSKFLLVKDPSKIVFTIVRSQPGSKPDKLHTVYTTFQAPALRQPLTVNFRYRNNGSGWKIFDVVIEGISMVMGQRAEITALISRHGIDEMIAMVEKKANGA